MHDQGLRVMYASLQGHSDIRQWSGVPFFITRALEEQGCQISLVDHSQRPLLTFNKAFNRVLSHTGIPWRMPLERSQYMARRIAGDVARQVKDADIDVVFSTSSIPIALLRSEHPKAFYTDCTFIDLLDNYPELSDYPREWREEGHELEHAALHNCNMAIYTSEWAARSAIDHYGADPSKVKVVPFGSNFEAHPPQHVVMDAVRSRSLQRCELLLIGVNWERKGGPMAWEVARQLNKAGIETRLTVLGCTPPSEMDAPFLRVMKFIGKDTVRGQEAIMRLMLDSHFLIVPSIAECFGIVYSEASAMGLPSLARDVGGVSNAVNNGRNGFLFPASAPAGVYVDQIIELFRNRPAYEQLARTSYAEYIARLNWGTSGETLCKLLRELHR